MSNKTVTDQMGRQVVVPERPQRIISLVPSQTELLYDLGLEERVVGITKFCIHPKEWLKEKAIIGGTKQVHYDKIAASKPDLILANKEENTQEIVETLAANYPVWVSDIYTLADSLDMIEQVGSLTKTENKAAGMVEQIEQEFENLKAGEFAKALYLIWRKPYMAAGKQTFINDMLQRAGLQNVLPNESRYPELSEEEIKSLKPEVVLLSSEPYPFKEKHIAELTALLPQAKIMLVDGEMFSWYGSRLQYAPDYIKSLKF